MAFGDLCQLADVKAWLSTGGPPGTTGGIGVTDDALLTRLISAASQKIESHLGRPLISQDWIEQRTGVGFLQAGPDARYVFAVWPVTAVAYVQVNGTMIPPAPIAPLTAPAPANVFLPPPFLSSFPYQWGYIFTPTDLLIRGYPVPRLGATVILQYTAGYLPSQIPADITQACIQLVAHEYRERSRIGEASKHLGDGSTVSYIQLKIPGHVDAHLSPYRAVAPVSAYVRSVAPDQTDPATLVSIAA